MPGDHLHTVSLSWPPTKQGKLLYLVRICQALAGIVLCVLGSIESAGRLVISPVFEPDPQAPGCTTSACANEAGHSFRVSSHREGRHFNERHVIRVQANANIFGPCLRFGRPGMTFDGMRLVFDRAIGRQIGCWDNDNQGVGRQNTPFPWIAMNGFAGSTGHLHMRVLVVCCWFSSNHFSPFIVG
jgi:hypothetical protein